jgi:hypothetical protein
MGCRRLAAVVTIAAGALLVPPSAFGQEPTRIPLRTSWGAPNLQGTWNNGVSTPLERPAEFGDKAVLTPEELAAYTAQRQAAREDRDSREGAGTDADVRRAYNALWFPVPGDAISRTSLILDPPDGRIPPLTAGGQQRADARRGFRNGPPAGPEDRSLWERCITRGVPRTPGGYNNHFQLVQTPDHVAILIEMIHEVRIIPLEERPHVGPAIRQWLGDSRGHWEGDTLVVETTNFTDKTMFRGSGKSLRLVERFTRADADTLDYAFTVDDPTTWTRSWSAAWPMTSLQVAVGGPDQVEVPQMFEYACHEGNYGLVGQLGGARAEERAADQGGRR